MDNEDIIKKLKILEINKSDQLLNNGLFYWYFKVFKTNKGNNKNLIEINLAKEELDKLTTKELINVLNEKIDKEDEEDEEDFNLDNEESQSDFYSDAENITLENCASLKIRSFSQVQKVLAISDKGFSYIQEENYLKALEIYEKITQNMKYEDEMIEYFSNIFYFKGLCRYHLDYFNEALKDLSFSIKLIDKFNRINGAEEGEEFEENEKFEILVLQAKVYEKLGDYKSAIKILSEFMKVFAEDPDWNPHYDYDGEDFFIELCFNLARLEKKRGQFDAAFNYMQNAKNFLEFWHKQYDEIKYSEYSKLCLDLERELSL